MKMKLRLETIIGDFYNETFDDCDQTSPILVGDCDYPTQLAYIAERNNTSQENASLIGNHRP